MGSRDSRRICGLDNTMSYIVYQNIPPPEFKESVDGPRMDGRTALDMQKLHMSVDVISQAKGSSFIEVGNTKVICGVYGPKEIQRGIDFKLTGQVSCEVKFAPFSSHCRRSPQPDRQQKEISRQLKEALEAVIIVEKYPKAQIDVYITVIEDGGSLLGSCLTAAGLALCHACIEVYDLVVGSSVLWHKGVGHVEPSLKEEEYLSYTQIMNGETGDGILSLGYMPSYANGQITLLSHVGALSVDNLSDGVDLAIDTCQRIYAIANDTLLTNAKRDGEDTSDED